MPKRILNWLKNNPGKVLVFSDEKNFHVYMYANSRNKEYRQDACRCWQLVEVCAQFQAPLESQFAGEGGG